VEAFAKYGFRALPVVDDANALKGVIGFRSVLRFWPPMPGEPGREGAVFNGAETLSVVPVNSP